jgi:Tautomerase enzyme
MKLLRRKFLHLAAGAAAQPAVSRIARAQEHAPEEVNFPASYLGNHYSQDVVFIQITLNAGRSIELKKAFYKRIVDDIIVQLKTRPDDVVINLTFEMLWGDPAKRYIIGAVTNQRSAAMANQNDLSRSVVAFEQRNTIIAVIEMSLNSWLVAGIVPGIERHPLKKLSFDEEMLLKLLSRWRDEAVKAGHTWRDCAL